MSRRDNTARGDPTTAGGDDAPPPNSYPNAHSHSHSLSSNANDDVHTTTETTHPLKNSTAFPESLPTPTSTSALHQQHDPLTLRTLPSFLASYATYYLRTFSFVLLMDSASASINLLQFPGLILHPISRRVYRQYMQWTQKLFGELIVLLTWVFTGRVEIVVTGEWEALSEERGGAIPEMKVIMANHQIYSDWWWLWIVAWSCGAHGSLKIILKKSLKYFPVFGWGMQFFEFIFLARKWSLDKSTLSTILHRASRDALPLWLVIFPEGTVITDDTKSKSRAYAKKMDLPDDPQHVLIPKSTGLFFCLRNLQPGCEYLYDVTIGYEGLTASQTPYEVYSLSRVFFEARGPERVHVHVERVRVAGLPGFEKADGEITEVEEEEQAKRFGEWLRKRFLRKDRLMSAFYRDGRFGGDDVDEPTTNANAAASSHTAASPDHTTSAGLTPTHTSQQPKLRDHRQHIIKPRPRATDFLALLATLTAGFLAARALWGWWI